VRIAYAAGFFKHAHQPVLDRFPKEVETRALVWVPSRRNSDEIDLNLFKADFFGAIARGADEILVCAFVMRGKEHLIRSLEEIIKVGQSRKPDLEVRLKLFKSARDSEGLIQEISSYAPTAEHPVPEELDSLEPWVNEHHGEKIVLHSRAVAGARKSLYSEVATIYRALDFLANEYWELKNSTPETRAKNSAFHDRKLQELGMDIAPTISETRAGEQGEEYKVIYPPGGQQRRLLELHLRKGSDRDTRFCLRIYFFWDEQLRKVVVGWLPSHLETRGS
jgi:hypothetical protein